MKTFEAKFYQEGNSKSFTFSAKGELANDKAKKLTNEQISEYLAKSLFKFVNLQNDRIKRGRKGLKLAITKELFFSFRIDGKQLVDTKLCEQVDIKIRIKDSNVEDVKLDILDIIEVMTENVSLA